jgi:hypothetical protein
MKRDLFYPDLLPRVAVTARRERRGRPADDPVDDGRVASRRAGRGAGCFPVIVPAISSLLFQ